jgi:hypothetical protein
MASRHQLIPRIAAIGTSFSPLPCQAWHGYGVTSAHRNHHTHYMWVRFLKSKDDTCSELETMLVDIKHLHARHLSQSGACAPIIRFDSDSIFEAAVIRHMCAHLGVGVQFSAPYAHHMLGKAERPWRTIQDNSSKMLHSMAVPNSMWSCVVSTVVYLRNRTYSRYVGPKGGTPLTLLTSSVPDASKFRVFGCAVLAKVPDKLRR